MNFNLKRIPFSARGSYLAISEYTENFKGFKNSAGFYLRTVHGAGYFPSCTMLKIPPYSAQLIPTYNGIPAPFSSNANPAELVFKTENGKIRFCFANSDTILVRGDGKGIGLLIHATGAGYIFETGNGVHTHILINSAQSDRQFLIRTSNASYKLIQGDSDEFCRDILIMPKSGTSFAIQIEDVCREWVIDGEVFDYEHSLAKVTDDFKRFAHDMPSVTDRYAASHEEASYILWSALVKKEGFLKREAMLMAKNWMCDVWSWDHCFNAIALAYNRPDMAWDQYMLMFDYQDSTGKIPDTASNFQISWNFCKPPIHGWTLKKLMGIMPINDSQYAEAYRRLSAWTNWWLKYRDSDGDGICEYHHGNDSGWDNSTVFQHSPNMELPDLAAFLIIQMDILADLAEKLDLLDEANGWRLASANMLDSMLKHFYTGSYPKGIINYTHKEVFCRSLILYLPLILGEKLPTDIRTNLISQLKSGGFLTEYGLATEPPDSPFYLDDGYWRGPIWAPSTMLMVDAMINCGEYEFAKEIAKRFCDMADKNGFAENYNAVTGEGLRDRAYTWTSSIFLILAHEY